jgi:DNA-binding SARP family transcriptional activator/DNA polymerase III delta prime subunit
MALTGTPSPAEIEAGSILTTLRLQVLGPMRIWRDGQEVDAGPRQQALVLAVLLSRYGKPVGLGELVDAVWGENAPASAVNVLHKYIGSLRRLLEPALQTRQPGNLIVRRGNAYVCTPPPAVLDLAVFRERLAEARACAGRGEADHALDLYIAAIELWSGSTCEGLAEGVSASADFSAVNMEFFNACRSAAEMALNLGQAQRALPSLRLASRLDPLHEPLHASLMSSLDALGERAEALAVFDGVRRRLADELGIDPGQVLQSAHRRVLNPPPSEAATLPAPAEHAAGRPDDRVVTAEPYRVADFSGRLTELDAIRSFVTDPRSQRSASALLITGPPGVGKTTTSLEALHGAPSSGARLFVNLHGFDPEPLTPLQILRALLAQVYRGEEPPGSLDEASAAWRAVASATPVVVLLDNASSESQIRPVLAVDGAITVIVTSRRTLPGLEATERIALGPLPRGESEEMLATLIPESRRPGANLTALAEMCGDFPLALRIAGARIASRPQWSVEDFIERLGDERNRLQQLVAGDLAVETAFSLSYHSLHPTARQLFRSLSLLHDAAFSAEMAAAIDDLDPLICRDQLDSLADLGLLDIVRGDRYRIHDLLRLYAGDRLRDETAVVDARIRQRRLDRWILEKTATGANCFRSGWEPAPVAPLSTAEELPQAKVWLTLEYRHWSGALKSAADAGEHRLVVDTTMALMRISGEWARLGVWAEIHSLGADSALQLDDAESYVAQLAAVADAHSSPMQTSDSSRPGEQTEGMRAALRALSAAHSYGKSFWAARARNVLAFAYFLSDPIDWEAVLRESRRARDECEPQGDVSGDIDARGMIIRALTDLDPEQALIEAQAAIAVIDDLGQNPEHRAHTDSLLNVYNAVSRLLLSLNRFDEVVPIATRILDLPVQFMDPTGYSARAYRHLGLAFFGLGRFEEAQVALETALANAGSYRPDGWAAEINEALDFIAAR